MPKSLKELCYSDQSLIEYVTGKARSLHRVYRNITEVEDLEHELWAHAFEALDNRYDGEKPLAEFVRADVYSAYGHLLPNKGLKRQNVAMVADADSVGFPDTTGFIDRQYELVEARFTIEQIESDLVARQNEARNYKIGTCYYRIGYDQIKYFKTNGTDRPSEFAKDYGISKTHSYFVYGVVKKVAQKYSPTMGQNNGESDTGRMEA